MEGEIPFTFFERNHDVGSNIKQRILFEHDTEKAWGNEKQQTPPKPQTINHSGFFPRYTKEN